MKMFRIFSVFLLLCTSATGTDVWVSHGNTNSFINISTKGGKVNFVAPAPGVIRALAATQDGLYIYATFADSNGIGGLAVYDVVGDFWSVLPQPGYCTEFPGACIYVDHGKLAIDSSGSILYVATNYLMNGTPPTPTTFVDQYDISALPSGGRANQWVQWIPGYGWSIATSGTQVATGILGWSYQGVGYYDTATGMNWTTGTNAGVYDVLFSPDGTRIIVALASPQSLGGNTGNIAFFASDPILCFYGACTAFNFGSMQVTWLAAVGSRFYGTTGDGRLYSASFSGTTYAPPRQLGNVLTGMAFGSDGKLYVADWVGVVYPITIGTSPDRDRVGKGYALPVGFQPWAVTVTNTSKK